jgi:hypothetical protein
MDNSPLARLPRELRDQIYSHTLFSSDCRIHYPNAPFWLHLTALLHVCRQFSVEARAAYYSRNDFYHGRSQGRRPVSALRAAEHLTHMRTEIVANFKRFKLHHHGVWCNAVIRPSKRALQSQGRLVKVNHSNDNSDLNVFIDAYRSLGLSLVAVARM